MNIHEPRSLPNHRNDRLRSGRRADGGVRRRVLRDGSGSGRILDRRWPVCVSILQTPLAGLHLRAGSPDGILDDGQSGVRQLAERAEALAQFFFASSGVALDSFAEIGREQSQQQSATISTMKAGRLAFATMIVFALVVLPSAVYIGGYYWLATRSFSGARHFKYQPVLRLYKHRWQANVLRRRAKYRAG